MIPLGGEGVFAAVMRGGGLFRAVGIAPEGLSAFSAAPDSWIADDAGFTTPPSEKGLVDIAFRDGMFYGCGYDDAGPPYAVVAENDGSGWTPIEAPGVDLDDRELSAIAVTGDGALLIGGSIADASSGTVEYAAFLLIRGAAGEWIEGVLPEADRLDRVNDILVASDGTTFLGGGLEETWIARQAGEGVELEGPRAPGRIASLCESPDGVVHAAGSYGPGGIFGRAVILRREP
jgi:hypothetical protein